MLLPFIKHDLVKDILLMLYDEVDEDDYEVIMIKAYIVNAINKCKSLEDMLLILPIQTHSAFPDYAENTLDASIQSLTEAEVLDFQEEHSYQAQLFKERLLLNLLTK